MENEVLVDSNVYIRLLKHGKDPVLVLSEWADGRDLAICGMVRLEVLRGITQPKTYRRISDFMDVMVNVPSDRRLWNESLDLVWKMDRQGLVIPVTDAVIAASAMRLKAAVMTSDKHFSLVEGLRVIAPPAEWF